jgi:hypothetical protein
MGLVPGRPPDRVAEDRPGGIELCHPLLRPRIRSDIRVVASSLAAVGNEDRPGVGTPRDADDRVRVELVVGHGDAASFMR